MANITEERSESEINVRRVGYERSEMARTGLHSESFKRMRDISIVKLLWPLSLALIALVSVFGCAPKDTPIPGPDKQGAGLVSGAALGAGSGAITGAQFTAATGPGALIGAGFGAVWGALQGFGLDLLEEEDLRLLAEVEALSGDAWVHYSLIEHYERKRELFPTRDIFPADVFFKGDTVLLTPEGRALAQSFATMIAQRNVSSRIQIDCYHMSSASSKEGSRYAEYLGEKRAIELARALVASGISARRISTRAVIIGSPLVLDPYDAKQRYNQAIEFSLLDG